MPFQMTDFAKPKITAGQREILALLLFKELNPPSPGGRIWSCISEGERNEWRYHAEVLVLGEHPFEEDEEIIVGFDEGGDEIVCFSYEPAQLAALHPQGLTHPLRERLRNLGNGINTPVEPTHWNGEKLAPRGDGGFEDLTA